MELQQIFDKVSNHLLTQNRKSLGTSSGSSCAYRGVMGATCAVGCLIPDNEYLSSMEGQSIDADEVWAILFPIVKAGKHVRGIKFDLLEDLQHLHDFNSVPEWPDRLQECANNFNLTFTPLAKGI